MKTPTLPNARFRVWLNDQWVMLTLKPLQTLEWHYWHRDEEGYSAAWYKWEWQGAFIVESVYSEGRDCDGKVSRGDISRCHYLALNADPVLDWTAWNEQWSRPGPHIEAPLPSPGMFKPAWKTVESTQRDFSAEAAGY